MNDIFLQGDTKGQLWANPIKLYSNTRPKDGEYRSNMSLVHEESYDILLRLLVKMLTNGQMKTCAMC